MNEHDYCNCDPSLYAPAISVRCCECGYKTYCEESELDEKGYFFCGECAGEA